MLSDVAQLLICAVTWFVQSSSPNCSASFAQTAAPSAFSCDGYLPEASVILRGARRVRDGEHVETVVKN